MKSLIIFLFVSLLFISTSCDSTTEPSIEKSLNGTVKDIQGNLLSDVKVFIIYDYGQGTGIIQSRSLFNKPFGLTGVDLYSFTAVLFNSGAKLDWVTLSELNNTGFEIQRKTSNSDWEVVGFVAGVGTTTDTSYYSFTDRNMEAGIYWYRLKIIEFNANYEYSPEVQFNLVYLPLVSAIEQNYPNPFDISTTILFQLRKTANVKIDVCRFKDKSILFNLLDFQLNPGKYNLHLSSDSLPNNGYKVLLNVQESDSTYTLEKNILKTFRIYDQSMLTGAPNAITKSGVFEIKYDDIPFGQNFYLTGEADPTPLGEFRLRNNLKLVIYKPGFKVVQKDVAIDLNEGQEVQITLEAE
jgi:hypothetical protein